MHVLQRPHRSRMTKWALFILMLLVTGCQLQNTPPTPSLRSTPIAALVTFQQEALSTPTAVPQAIIDAADAEYMLLTNIYDRLAPSIVNIDVTINLMRQREMDYASGSGFVYDSEGHIVTNAHVVSDATEISVTFDNGSTATAEVVGFDLYSDLAVIKVDLPPERLFPVTFGDSDSLRVGERAVAIGNPFGLATSMTVGIISGLGRQLPSAELIAGTGPGFDNPSIIQVDTDINPGNSGGPLLNSRGEVIGVNTAIRTESGVFSGVGFAVPASTVQRVVPELIANERVEYSWLGISTLPSENGFTVAALAEPLNLPVQAGVLVERITPNSPAWTAGLLGGSRPLEVRGRETCAGGDIIVAVDSMPVQTMDDLVAYLVAHTRPGDTVTLLVVRGNDTYDIPVKLAPRPDTVADFSPCGA